MKRFDLKKLTLTDFDPDEYAAALAAAAGAAPPPRQAAVAGDLPANAPAAELVPRGRTTLNLNKSRGIIQAAVPPAAETQPPPKTATVPLDIDDTRPDALTAADVDELEPMAAVVEPPPPAPPVAVAAEPDPPRTDTISENITVSPPRTEAAAALHVRGTPRPRQPKKAIDPQDLILVNFRIPKYLKDSFFKACKDDGRTPSIVIRNLMKSFCGM